MHENPLTRISYRWLEVLQEEIGRWMSNLLKDAFNPGSFIDFVRRMGLDVSQLSSFIGQQPDFDPYRILGLDTSASEEEIKKRYRDLLHKLHPDTAGMEGTGFLLQMVLMAYETIKRDRGWN